MKTELTEEQIASYHDQGFLVVEDFLDSTELANWRTVTQEAVDTRLETNRRLREEAQTDLSLAGTLDNQANPDSYYAQVFTQCLKLIETSPAMREIICDPKLGKVVATLAGVDGIRVWHDQALFKPPYGNPTGWHLDNPYWSFSSKHAISIWVPLDDATLENGCLYYVPGSHKTARYDNAGIGEKIGDLFKVYPEWREISTVAGPCKAGSAVFHNGLTAHGAGANMTNKPRRAMTCAFMPDGATFNGQRNILPDAYFDSLTIGDVLDDDSVNPLVWHRDRDTWSAAGARN